MTGVRASLARWWSAFSATQRRRIVLGSLVAVSLAARDLILFCVATGLFALGEVAPAPGPRPQAS